MVATTIEFADLLVAALVVGAMFGIWLSSNPTELSAAAYVAQQQHTIRGLNVTMPAMGALTVVLTIVAALLARGDRWGPYRTYASLYLWRIADFDTKTKAKVPLKRSQD